MLRKFGVSVYLTEKLYSQLKATHFWPSQMKDNPCERKVAIALVMALKRWSYIAL